MIAKRKLGANICVNFLGAFYALVCFSAISSALWDEYYQIDNIAIPKHIDPQIGGLTVLKDGRIAVAFHRGEILLYSPDEGKWQQFAHGLHEPLGMVEGSDKSLIVMQLPELTRLVDEDKDSVADFYQTLTDDFGMTGNYHEFAFGPVQDSHGNLYFALNVASNYAGIFEHIRGEFSPIGLSQDIMTNWQTEQWKQTHKFAAGRMFSKAPYRGWIMKVTPEGKTVPFASGFRSPDGLLIDANNRLWVTDNQGDWLGTSPLYEVKEGHFYGHPASLVWKEGWTMDPVTMSAIELNKIRSLPAAWFPHGELANSPTQPIVTPANGTFGLPANEIIIGDMNQPRLIRFLRDEVNGHSQGTLIPFLETDALGIGNHRFDFDQAGDLWVGKTHLGWAGGEGVRKISWKRKPLFLVTDVERLHNGFRITFNQPIKKVVENVMVEAHGYHYHADYGSEKVNERSISISKMESTDNTMLITLDKMSKQQVYTISLKGMLSDSGLPIMGDTLYYSLME